MPPATAAEIRAWAAQNGHDVPIRGNLPKGLREEYEAFHGDPGAAGDAPDYDGGVTDDDFVQATLPADPEDPPMGPESQPRRVRASKAAKGTGLRERMWGSKVNPGPKKKAKKKPRVPVDRLIGRGWELLARFVAPVDLPVARVLEIQAPVAGVLLEDVVKDTLIDSVLQPLARLEQGSEILFALAGPPVAVAALHRFPEAAPVLLPVLEEAFLTWLQIAGPKAVEAKRKKQEFEEEFGADIRAMIRAVFKDIPGFDPDLEAPPSEEQQAQAARDEQLAEAQRLNNAAFGDLAPTAAAERAPV
jgi:hypothetical protein